MIAKKVSGREGWLNDWPHATSGRRDTRRDGDTEPLYAMSHAGAGNAQPLDRQKLQLVQLRLRSSSIGLLFSGITRPKFSSQLAKYTDTELEVVG